MRPYVFALSFLAVAAASALAQSANYVQPGQVFAAAGPWLGEMTVSGSSSTPHVAATSIDTVLWDPALPDSFIVGSGSSAATGGQLARMTFTAPGQVTTTLVAAVGAFARPVSLAWDATPRHLVALTYYAQLHRIDVTNGSSQPITSGTQPWGSTATCHAVSPTTADIYVGTSAGTLYRVASGGGSAQLVRSGLGTLVALLIDGPNDRLFLVGDRRLARLDLGSLGAPEYFFGSLGTPTYPGSIVGASFDHRGDLMLAESYAITRLANVSRIPAGGLAPVPHGVFRFPSSAGYVRACTVVGSDTRPFRVIAQAVPPLGAYVAVQNVPPATTLGYTLMSTTTYLPIDTGPLFGLLPDALTFAVLALPPSQGNLFAFTGTTPQPLVVPPLGMAPFAGMTFDFVSFALGAGSRFLGRSNVARVTWN